MSEFASLSRLCNIPLSAYTAFGVSLHLLMDSRCFHLTAAVTDAAVNVAVQICSRHNSPFSPPSSLVRVTMWPGAALMFMFVGVEHAVHCPAVDMEFGGFSLLMLRAGLQCVVLHTLLAHVCGVCRVRPRAVRESLQLCWALQSCSPKAVSQCVSSTAGGEGPSLYVLIYPWCQKPGDVFNN